jgi:hypothetical protein
MSKTNFVKTDLIFIEKIKNGLINASNLILKKIETAKV